MSASISTLDEAEREAVAKAKELAKRAKLRLSQTLQLWLPLGAKRRVLFLWFHGRWGNFNNPQSFSEKVNWRILNDRRSELVWTCDKLETKERAAEAGVRSPETYWQGDSVTGLEGVRLPDHWVLKPNHRSALVHFGQGDPKIEDLRKITNGWTDENQSKLLGEWAYSKARQLLLIEEQLEPDGTPLDYKFFVMNGKTEIIQVDVDRFGDHRRNVYTPDWVPVDTQYLYPNGGPVLPPKRLSDMCAAAELIAGGLDFLRVDLYNIDGTIYLGEVAAYPGSGLERYRPYSYDLQLGSRWRLPINYREV